MAKVTRVEFSFTDEDFEDLIPERRVILERVTDLIVDEIANKARRQSRSAQDNARLPKLSRDYIEFRRRSRRLNRRVTSPSQTRSNLSFTGQLLDSLTFDFERQPGGEVALVIFFGGLRSENRTLSNAEVYSFLIDMDENYNILGITPDIRSRAERIVAEEIEAGITRALRRRARS